MAGSIVTDFPSAHANPNGVWSYGYKSTATGSLTLFLPGHFFDNADSHGYHAGDSLAVYRPEVDGTSGTVFLDDDFVNMHPNSGGLIPVVRWTAPAAGTYDVSFLFKAQDTNPSGVNLAVLVNDVVEWSNSFAAGNTLQTRSGSFFKVLGAGSTVDFQLDYAGTYVNDSTGLQGTITTLNAVPEPSTVALLAGGLAALLIRRRRA